ncbi:MAG: hypothetical protein IT349_18330 [Candidatus Eisenbacteria bacterium]|nr:hypothetical protein [Candidatus Eisenbacteria bacterium]MCC7144058.1 hypothetical protein [Candidatus Eisenbacteria bacterium]
MTSDLRNSVATRIARFLPVGAVALILGLGLTGCGRELASGPAEDEPKFIAGSVVDGGGAISNGSGSGRAKKVKRQLVVAAQGGTIVNGRYSITVPPGALSYDTEYQVTDNNNGFVECDLSPHGAQFNAPVTLEIDLNGTTGDSDCTVYWWNASTHTWVDMQGHVNPATNVLSVQLPHFSKYRAGW